MARIIEDTSLDYDDVTLLPRRSTIQSRSEVKLYRDFQFYHSNRKWFGLPIIIPNMFGVGTFQVARKVSQRKIITWLHKHYSLDELIKFYTEEVIPNNWQDYVFYSLGTSTQELLKLNKFITYTGYNPNIRIDNANAYRDDFILKSKRIRALSPESIIMGGNICTSDMIHEMIIHSGIDVIVVGIGSGKNCSTRRVTGVGQGQITSIDECSNIAHGLKNGNKKLGLVVSDGGIRNIGDFSKSFCVGADFCAAASFFAGCTETGNEEDWEYEKDTQVSIKKQLKFRGMSSQDAQIKAYGKMNKYRTSEGVVSYYQHKGPILDLFDSVEGGLKSTGSYIGANSIKYFSKCATFRRINRIHDTNL